MLHQLVCQLSPSSLRRLLLSFGRASDSEYEKAPHNIDGSVMDVLATLGDFKNMIIFLEHFGLDKVLEGKGTKKGHRWFDDIVRDMDTSGPYTVSGLPTG